MTLNRTLSNRCFTLSALSAALMLAACGNDDDTAAAPVVPPVVAVTKVTGAVVKGPVSGAQVCGFAVAGSARGAALGTCETTDANGNYTLSVPVGSGPLWLEASGGTYTDEATGASATLPTGSVLASLATANGGEVTAMLTPLTTLALNAARAAAGSAGTLDAAAFEAAAKALLATFGLPTTLDLATTLPAFGTAANDYGTALTIISRMIAAGLTLADLLATADPATLQTAYAAAAAPVPVPVPVNNAQASGTLTLAGSHPVVAAYGNFTPAADGFKVEINSGEEIDNNLNQPANTVYRFYKTVAKAGGAPITVELTVVIASGGSNAPTYVRYSDGGSNTLTCGGCRATLSTPAGATHPVTLSFDKLQFGSDFTLDGSLVGDVSDAIWSPAGLPGTTAGAVGINGTDVAIADSFFNPVNQRIGFVLADGSLLDILGGATASLYLVTPTVLSCFSNCGMTVTPTASGATLAFANTTLVAPGNLPVEGPRVLTGNITIGKTSGTLTSTTLGSFAPASSTLRAVNGALTTNFVDNSNGEGGGIVSLAVTASGGRVSAVVVELGGGGGGQTYACGGTAPACAGITVSANGLDLTFADVSLAGTTGSVPAEKFSGILKAKGR